MIIWYDLNEVTETYIMVVVLMILDSLEELQKTQLAHKQEHFLTFNGHKNKSHPCASHCNSNDAG